MLTVLALDVFMTTVSHFSSEKVRYDRQTRLWGEEVQMSLRNASVYVDELSALTSELTKNIILAGVGRIIIGRILHSSYPTHIFDVLRGSSVASRVQSLNPFSKILLMSDLAHGKENFVPEICEKCSIFVYQDVERLYQAVDLGQSTTNASQDSSLDKSDPYLIFLEAYGGLSRMRCVSWSQSSKLAPSITPVVDHLHGLEFDFYNVSHIVRDMTHDKAGVQSLPSVGSILIEYMRHMNSREKGETSYSLNHDEEARLVYLASCVRNSLGTAAPQINPICASVLRGFVAQECIKRISERTGKRSATQTTDNKEQVKQSTRVGGNLHTAYSTLIIDAIDRCEALAIL